MAPWPFQQTFKTPLKNLDSFVGALSDRISLERCALNTDSIVFEPRYLLEFLSRSSIQVEDQWEFILSADSVEECAGLLVAALSDWIDFCLVPQSERFAIYADHDEYITFYAPTEEIVNAIRLSLVDRGFDAVAYTRPPLDRSSK